jgi:hypothetical protein
MKPWFALKTFCKIARYTHTNVTGLEIGKVNVEFLLKIRQRGDE